MIRSYITIAWRNILRNKTYSAINIFGLSVGVACCLMLVLYIQDDISFDRHHARLEDLYRVITTLPAQQKSMPSASPPIAMALQREVPEVEVAARMVTPLSGEPNLITYGDKIFYEHNGFIADATLFDVLTYEFILGHPAKALTHPNSLVITDQLARKLFGDEPALDKMIHIQGVVAGEFKITGVIRENPHTYLPASFIASANSSGGWAEYMRAEDVANQWAGQNFAPTLLRLSPGHDKEAVVKKINQVLQKYGAADMKALGMQKTLDLEPIGDIYLRSDIDRRPRITYLYSIASIAVFILLIACINFMNLSTARATKRAGEIGIRKVMGAFRSSLVRQILGEAMVIVTMAILLSLVLVQLGLPFFSQLTGKTISFGSENMLLFGLALAAITLLTGLIAGSYPAFYLSSFQPAQVLKGKSGKNTTGWLRRSLVVFQFMIAIMLVCGMIIISRQLDFVQKVNLGFSAEAKIILPLRSATAGNSYEALKNELVKAGGVKQVSGAHYMPGSVIYSDAHFYTEGKNMDHAIDHGRNMVDYGYLELLEIPLIAGRSFSDNREMEREKVVVNRTSAKQLGFEPAEMIGQRLYTEWNGQKYSFEVIGVTEDYHQRSLRDPIEPVMLHLKDDPRGYDFMIVSVSSGAFQETVAGIEATWKTLIGDTPFEYSFLDNNIQKQYAEDRKVSVVINVFTVLAMLISCLGLYGLSTYMAERRFKEIGVRKVLGASVTQITGMMSGEFVRLVIVALILSVPLSWYAMEKWLQGFTYKVSVDVMIFIYAGATAVVIALLTVSVESIRAASANPVKALRSE